MTTPTDLIGTALPARTVAGFKMIELARYSAISGDDNPIHRDPALARAAGLSDCAVHGMLIVGQFEETLRIWRDDVELVASSTRFVRPAIVNEPLEIGGRVVAASNIKPADLVVRLDVRGASKQVICLGDVHVRLKAGRVRS